MLKRHSTYKILIAVILSAFTVCASADGVYQNDTIFTPYSIKAGVVTGYIYPHDKDLVAPAVKGPAVGADISFEWHTNGSRRWHKDFNYPTVGVALEILDMSNKDVLGQIISPYAFINIPMVRSRVVDFNFMFGGGLGFETKPFDKKLMEEKNYPALKDVASYNNCMLGGPLAFNIRAGVNVDVKVHKNVALTAGVEYNHFSSGSIFQPNSGVNMFNGKIGVKYSPVLRSEEAKRVEVAPDSAKMKRWYGEVIASGGFKKLYYKDSKVFGCASLNIGGYYRTCRQHRIGLGVDLFYDGAYCQTAVKDKNGKWTDYKGETGFGRTFTKDDKFANKLRVGLDITNELMFERFLIGFGFGIYLYDPVKNMEPYGKAKAAADKGESLDKGFFYSYDINKEDGWNYFRLSCKYYITKHLLVQLAFKTHLQKVEFVEFGVGTWF